MPQCQRLRSCRRSAKGLGAKTTGGEKSRFCSVECVFWLRFDKSGGPDLCWIWIGSVNPQTGYGTVGRYVGGGKRTSAHRHAYRLAIGDPGEMSVLHRCDVRLCGNPKHLRLGTALDNRQDLLPKGRQTVVLPGEANRNAKLTKAEVTAIRRSAARVADLVRQFGVNKSTIRMIIRQEAWRHVPQEEPAAEMAPTE